MDSDAANDHARSVCVEQKDLGARMRLVSSNAQLQIVVRIIGGQMKINGDVSSETRGRSLRPHVGLGVVVEWQRTRFLTSNWMYMAEPSSFGHPAIIDASRRRQYRDGRRAVRIDMGKGRGNKNAHGIERFRLKSRVRLRCRRENGKTRKRRLPGITTCLGLALQKTREK